ncbi:MAG: hypothetical protein QM804_05595 [Propionicimonas sp.]
MTEHSDAALLAELRELWQLVDPVPDDLADQIVTAITMADFAQEWELLALVTNPEYAAVRGEAEPVTLQFSAGSVNVLLHVSASTGGKRRVDGWVDDQVARVELLQETRNWVTEPNPSGRFEFDLIPAGYCRLCLHRQRSDGSWREFRTPEFEV